MKQSERMVIIDGNALVHRAFHALPPLTNKNGEMVNAVYGFFLLFLRAMRELHPSHVVVAFDSGKKTFRHKMYKEYKAQRKSQPDELYEQMDKVKEILEAFSVPILTSDEYEADDIIGTLVEKFSDPEKIIVTGDMDTLQLVDHKTRVYTLKKGVKEITVYDAAAVKERFGLVPAQLIDYKILRGDPSDNLPGVPGVGEKTASDLLQKYKNIEGIYKNLEALPPKLQEKLRAAHSSLEFGRTMATIVKDVSLDIAEEDCLFGSFDEKRVKDLFQKYGFFSLLQQLPSVGGASSQGTLFSSQPKESYPEFSESFLDHAREQKKLFFLVDEEGMACSLKNGENAWIPLAQYGKIKKILEDISVEKIGHDLKHALKILEKKDIHLHGLTFDTMIASYVANSGNRQHAFAPLLFTELGYQIDDPKHASHLLVELQAKLKQELEEKHLKKLFETVEMPLIEVLASMEIRGVEIDASWLGKLSKQYAGEIHALEQKIHQLAGEEFNIASPLQLRKILYEKLLLKTARVHKTKTGLSTSSDVLQELRGQHPIIELIERIREISKLKTTYLDTLPHLTDQDQRVHTTFHQTVAATGRLSSSDPNLQNIPPVVRSAFVAKKGYKLLKADYSQIELRIIASLSGDEKLLDSFQKKEDVHKRTAADIFGVPLESVTSEMRRQAKTINFGIIYGMGARGLADAARIPYEKAKLFLETYFSLYSGVRDYIETTKALAHKMGYVETLFGRRRYVTEINSQMMGVQAASERMAVNMPVQGTQADIIKLAMIQIHRELPDVSMILQVHDELVFELPEKNVSDISKKIRNIMENVCKLRCAIEVDLALGENWETMQKI